MSKKNREDREQQVLMTVGFEGSAYRVVRFGEYEFTVENMVVNGDRAEWCPITGTEMIDKVRKNSRRDENDEIFLQVVLRALYQLYEKSEE